MLRFTPYSLTQIAVFTVGFAASVWYRIARIAATVSFVMWWMSADALTHVKDESARLLEAFGAENSTCDFDWDANYGGGFESTADMRVVPVEQCERVKTA